MSVVSAPPVSPYKGLAAFADSELDALFFFGRERERDVIVANLLASRLTVLYGESGVGKSSLLAAAVVRDLREAAPEARILLHATWSGERPDFADELAGGEGYLILDQFEEYFLYHDDALLESLPELLETTRVNVLIALREDSLARLDAFKARIPGVFANQLRLEHLSVEQARRAILGPLARWEELTGEHVDAEPALVEAIVAQVAVDGERVEAPYLQLVLERVWEAERDAGSWLLRGSTLDALGGAAAIVRDQFHGALEGLPPAEQDVAAAMFEHLVTPSGTKIALRAPDLAGYAGVDEPTLRHVLAQLTSDRIVHSVEGSDRYEIFHDVLAEPVSAWRLQRRLERERAAARRRQRRLYAGIAVALVALAVVAALAVWALAERGTARQQAHHARARELEATALQQLTIDPSRSLRIALQAARYEASPAAENVLRQALVADRLRQVRREPAAVSAVAVSPDRRLVAVALGSAGVRLQRLADGSLVRSLPMPGAHDVAFSADGKELVAATASGRAARWNVATGATLDAAGLVAARLPSGRLELVRARGDLAHALPQLQELVAAPGGRLIAGAVQDRAGHRKPWIFGAQGRRLRVLPEIGIHALSFSPDGTLLAASSATGTTVLWSTRTWRSVHRLPDSNQGAEVIAFSPDGKLLATGGADSGVRVWTVATGERTYFLFGHTNPVKSLVWSPDGRVLATGSLDRTIRLWRVQNLIASGSLAATLPGDTDGVVALAFSPNGTTLVSGSLDRTVRTWSATPDEQLRAIGRAPGAAIAAQWAGDTIAAVWSSGVGEVWNGQTQKRVSVFRAKPRAAYTALGLSHDGGVVAAGRSDGSVDVLRPDGSLLHGATLPASVVAVAVSPRGDAVAAADTHGRVELWEPGRPGFRWRVHVAPHVAALAFSPGGETLAAAGTRGTTLLAVKDGRQQDVLGSPDGDVRVAYSPNGRVVGTAGLDGVARLWSASTGRLQHALRRHTQPLTDIVFSRDGRDVATSGHDADIRVWNVATGRGHVLQRRAFGSVAAVGFDRSGRWIVGAAPIAAVIWQSRPGLWLFYLRGHGPLLTSASFAPDRPIVLTSSQDGTVRTYDCEVCVDLRGLVALAEQRLRP